MINRGITETMSDNGYVKKNGILPLMNELRK